MKNLLSKPATWLLVGGVALGVVATVGFNEVVHYTSTNEFCQICHADNAYKEWQQSIHYRNPKGIVVDCHSCHIPREFIPKMTVKTLALADVWKYLRGDIDTAEKYEARRLHMAATEWARMTANQSRECRNCHNPEAMADPDKPLLRPLHIAAQKDGQICTECHEGIAHTPPVVPEEAE